VGLGAALVAVVVAVIGAGAGFIGGYLSAHWRARSDLAQWRRDRLLVFCGDLIAAGRELLGQGWEGEGQRGYPTETVRRFDGAVALVLLLGGQDLDDPTFAYQGKVMDALNAVVAPKSDSEKQQQTQKAALEAQAQFLWLAHNLLLDLPQNPREWWQVWRLIQRT
jgi:hypothetical protein